MNLKVVLVVKQSFDVGSPLDLPVVRGLALAPVPTGSHHWLLEFPAEGVLSIIVLEQTARSAVGSLD